MFAYISSLNVEPGDIVLTLGLYLMQFEEQLK